MLKLVIHDVPVCHREMGLNRDQGIEECRIHTLTIAASIGYVGTEE